MSHAAGGRHRAAPPSTRGTPRGIWLVVGLVVIALALASVFLWPDDSATTGSLDRPEPASSTRAATPSPSEFRATVESSRDVTLEGDTVTVEEVSTVIDGETVRAVPTELTPLGLDLISSSVITADGRSTAFDSPVTLDVSGSLTVRTRFRLTDCPDVIPTQWPSPTDFPGATRSYSILDGPLHTAYAICPESTPAADSLPDLSGEVVAGNAVRVRLTWLGAQTLTVKAIGSASGVAALVPNPDCDASCVASVAPGGATEIQLAPIDPCPPATDNNRLTLVVQISGSVSTVAVNAPGLADAICS